MSAHEVEDRLAVLNARRILADPKALKERKQVQAEKDRLAKRDDLRRAMDALSAMRPDPHWRL